MALCLKLGLNALREGWLPSVSSLPLAGEITEGEAGREDFFNGLLRKRYRMSSNEAASPAADLQRELDVAREAALSAGEILERCFRDRGFEIDQKGKDNPVTTADFDADHEIKRLLRAPFPDYGWLSEETADNSDRLSCHRVWIVDPLDGTKEFIKGIPEFVIAIALAEDGHPILGVTYNPIKRELFWAARGAGCHLGARRVRVTRTRTLARATVLASRSEA